jgi:hypothetical protein
VPLKVVLHSDGLIKLAKAGVLGMVVGAWECLVPRAVYAETVERGVLGAYPDALVIRNTIAASMVHPSRRHPKAASILHGKPSLGRGEQESLSLFLTAGADAIVSDDAAFVALLDQARVPYLLPALVLVELAGRGRLPRGAALSALEKMRPWTRRDVYRLAREDLERVQGKPGKGHVREP